MATSVYIRGLSGAGFRVPTNGSATALQRVTENLDGSSHNYQVDLDQDKTQKILFGEHDNFVRVAAQGSTTATIIGLTRYGFRIKDNGGTLVTVRLGSGVHTIALNPRTFRVLRRNYGRYAFSASATSLVIRGIVAQQAGFEISASKGENTTVIALDNSSNNAANTETVVVGAKTYTFKTALTEVKATGTVTTSSTGAANGDTVVIGATTYTFKTVLTGAANEVLRTGVIDVDLTNLKAAVNAEAGAGTTYGTGTVANASVTCGAVVSHVVTLTAKVVGTAGNSIALTKTGSILSVSGSGTLSGGVASVANEVKVGGSGDASLTNLAEAINAGANAGTDYSTATTANADATSSAVAAHAITLSKTETASGTITVSTTAAHLTVSNATVENPLQKVYSGVSATVNPQDPTVYTQLRRHFKSWVEA